MNIDLLIEKLRNNKLLQHFSFNMMASLTVQIRSILLVWIAAKYLSTEDYGIFALILMLIMTAADLSDMGINSAVTRFSAQYYENKEYKKELLIVICAFKRKIFNAIIVVCGMNIFSNEISIWILGTKEYAGLVSLSSIGVLFALFSGLNISVLQGRKRFQDYWKIVNYVSVAFIILIAYSYFFLTFTIENLIIYYILLSAGTFLLSFCYLKFPGISLAEFNIKDDYIKNKFNSFGFWMFLWALFSVLQSKIDMLMLARLATIEEVAYYDIAMKITKPLLMVFSAYGQVLNPMMSSISCKTVLIKQISNTKKFVIFMTAILLVAVLLSKIVLVALLGDKYINSVIPLQIIIVALIFFMWTMPFNSALFAMNKPQVFTLSAISGLIVTIIGNCFLLNTYGAIGAAVTFLMAQVLGWAISCFFYRKILKSFRWAGDKNNGE